MTKTALYRASLLIDNLGVRLCLAAALVMPSALVLLAPMLGLIADGAPTFASALPLQGGTWFSASLALVVALGFAAAWTRIAVVGQRLLRRPGLRLFVVVALAAGACTLALELALRALTPRPDDDAGWLLFAALAVQLFLLAGTLGQPRPDRLNRL